MTLPELLPEDLVFLQNRLKEIYNYIDSRKIINDYYKQGREKEMIDRLESWGSELAVSRWADVKYLGERPGEFGAPDVGYYGQIKWSRPSPYKLNLLVQIPRRPGKRPIENFAYGLTTGLFPKYELIGWIGGETMMKGAHIFENNKHSCYRYPQEDLRDDFDIFKAILQSDPA